ncbi:MAG: HEPN domain-containing protein [Nitrospiraceae bacterium]|nr:HEPN domain-containing protein [Nitrospiraceae bacterium]
MGDNLKESMTWFKQAENDLKASKNSLKSGDYGWACFQTQQSAEKALKLILFDDALKTFFEFKKDMRIAAVMELYKTDEMSLSKTAELAGVSTEEIKDHLAKAGLRIRRGFSNDKGKELAMLIE